MMEQTAQRSLLAAYDNEKDEGLEWNTEINLFYFLHFGDCKRELQLVKFQSMPKIILTMKRFER